MIPLFVVICIVEPFIELWAKRRKARLDHGFSAVFRAALDDLKHFRDDEGDRP